MKGLSKAEAARVMDQVEAVLSKKPESHPALRGRFAGLRRYRVGDYRIIYAMLGDDVLVLRIAHRRDVYRSET